MSDALIRDVPDDVLIAVDSHAAKLGLSRNEYLRRQLAQDAQRSSAEVTMADLRWFSNTFADLADPGSWRALAAGRQRRTRSHGREPTQPIPYSRDQQPDARDCTGCRVRCRR